MSKLRAVAIVDLEVEDEYLEGAEYKIQLTKLINDFVRADNRVKFHGVDVRARRGEPLNSMQEARLK